MLTCTGLPLMTALQEALNVLEGSLSERLQLQFIQLHFSLASAFRNMWSNELMQNEA